ncbi:unnamed protein product [Caenorhabditis bovis]|uniref:SH2 domain-containing protein n=1 Tax=Caenorhabditis bovis TaxID=2654633 RepID=A0A8S1FDK4_9PELO|nr:unnamed protein product [Caenorhabditis bovis]
MSLSELYDFGWYWGDLEWKWAERLLLMCPDGYYLVRDSRSESHLFSVSYKFEGKVLHTRISFERSQFHLGRQQPFLFNDYQRLGQLIQDSVEITRNGHHEMLVHRRGGEAEASRLKFTNPLMRRDLLPSLQYLCRFAIRTRLAANQLDTLPQMPPAVLKYVKDPKWIIPDLEACEQVLEQRNRNL